MNGKESQAAYAAVTFVSSVTCLLSGCMGLHRGLGDGQCVVAPATTAPAVAPETFSEKDRATLARVEEYLERTQDYELATVALSSSTAPAEATLLSPAGATPFYRADVNAPPVTEPPPGESLVSTASHTLPGSDGAFANTQVTLTDALPSQPQPALPVVQSVTVRTARDVELPPQTPAKASATNESLSVQPPEEPISLDRLVRHLESKTEKERDFDTEWQLRLLQLALNHDTQAAQISPTLPPDARRILSALVQVIVAARGAARNPLLIPQDAVQRADELREVLAEQADPVVSEVALCRRVVTFGVYDEMDDEDFLAGRTTQTIVYCELRNVRSQPTDEGRFRTTLATRLEVLSAAGQSMWQHEEDEINDLCRRRRSDFFLAQRITLPPTLPAGEYVLKVMVEDKLSGRVNEAIRRFAVTAPSSVAIGR